jgi:hypothetical protein
MSDPPVKTEDEEEEEEFDDFVSFLCLYLIEI